MKQFLSLSLCIGLQTFSFVTLVQAVKPSQTNITDAKSNRADIDTTRALVQLKGDPLSTYVKTKPAQGKKIDFGNNTVKSYRAQLSAQRNDFKSWLHDNAPKTKVTGEFDISLNAVSVELNGATLDTLRM